MGFRQNGYMTVWSTEPSSTGTTTKVRLSSSRKNKQTDQYEQDFSGFCTFIGQAHQDAAHLKPKDRIKILECDVGTFYDKEKKREYVNYKVFSFTMADGSQPAQKTSHTPEKDQRRPATLEEDLPEDDFNEEDCPF